MIVKDPWTGKDWILAIKWCGQSTCAKGGTIFDLVLRSDVDQMTFWP